MLRDISASLYPSVLYATIASLCPGVPCAAPPLYIPYQYASVYPNVLRAIPASLCPGMPYTAPQYRSVLCALGPLLLGLWAARGAPD